MFQFLGTSAIGFTAILGLREDLHGYTSSGPTISNGRHRNEETLDSRRFQFERLRSNQGLKHRVHSIQSYTNLPGVYAREN